MRDLEDGPQALLPRLARVRRRLGVLHLVGEFEEGVFDVVEAFGWGLAVLGCADGWHVCGYRASGLLCALK